MRKKRIILFCAGLLIMAGSISVTPATENQASGNPQNKVIGIGSAESVKPVKRVRVILPQPFSEVSGNIVKVFERQVARRCPVVVMSSGQGELVIELVIDGSIGNDGFCIKNRKEGGIAISGSNERGLLYGLGKLLRTSGYSQKGFAPGSWRGESVPQKPIRGIYFATHFHNYYHDAPVEEIERYVEELGLWGFNAVGFWYDMRYAGAGFDDPEAKSLRNRLTCIAQGARRIGLDVTLFFVANDSYQTTPAELRADARGMRGSIYPWNVCPSKPEGMKYILRVLGEEFDWAAALKPAYLVCWPYDSGGCGCENCRPWGSNGFLKTGAKIAEMARKKLPGAKIIASTWLFDDSEWAGMEKAWKEEKSWADMVLAEGHAWKLDGLPMVGFPEISMHETFPWGGFGATPLTGRAQQQWNAVRGQIAGGFPYSEGIFEDITKAAISQLYWNDRPVAETLREYAAFEYSPEMVDEIMKVIATLEQNHHWRWWPGELEGVKLDLNWFPSYGAHPQADPGAEDAWATVQQVDKALPQWVRSSWRWRILYLRALLDAELKANEGKPNARCNQAFEELIRLYHAEEASPALRPPVPNNK